ncbi:MAG: tRNA-dihydrouridine synthase, partial [Myxococcota bacterium]|nr:tRNA-dihydrouridine synthase [Myxococcota bacterium]
MPPIRPRYCVWELTLACDARCVHCGSFAGPARRQELTTAEALDAPLAVQLAGDDPDLMAEAARISAGLGARIIDINMGCPVKKVTKGNAGSALMRD